LPPPPQRHNVMIRVPMIRYHCELLGWSNADQLQVDWPLENWNMMLARSNLVDACLIGWRWHRRPALLISSESVYGSGQKENVRVRDMWENVHVKDRWTSNA
jgi:hypothetical protein